MVSLKELTQGRRAHSERLRQIYLVMAVKQVICYQLLSRGFLMTLSRA
jgi:hypothetical protein